MKLIVMVVMALGFSGCSKPIFDNSIHVSVGDNHNTKDKK